MLASLLPGLRDVRTPLTVGYLWLATFWLIFLPSIPLTEPGDDGVVKRLFTMGQSVGIGAALAAASFAAYLLGSVLTVSVENTGAGRLLTALSPYFITPTGQNALKLYASFLREDVLRGFEGRLLDDIEPRQLALSEVGTPSTEFRARLLIANSAVFGEYDRLMSEAEFRLNVSPPILVLAVYCALSFSGSWLALVLVVIALLVQGTSKLAQSVVVLQRAVTTGVITHPMQSEAKRAEVLAELESLAATTDASFTRVYESRTAMGARTLAVVAAVISAAGTVISIVPQMQDLASTSWATPVAIAVSVVAMLSAFTVWWRWRR